MHRFVALFALALAALIVSNGIYYCRRPPWPNLKAEIAGRRGTVVSFWPFDLRVTVNVAANDGDRREWISTWRWKARLFAEPRLK
jgi:hypothetical protein